MNYRSMGFASLIAVAAAATAHAQSANPQGQAAYPAPAATGEITTHVSPVAKPKPATMAAAKPAPAPTAVAAPGTVPTKQGMAAARALATKPSDTAIPYVDFAPEPATKAATTGQHGKPAKKPSA